MSLSGLCSLHKNMNFMAPNMLKLTSILRCNRRGLWQLPITANFPHSHSTCCSAQKLCSPNYIFQIAPRISSAHILKRQFTSGLTVKQGLIQRVLQAVGIKGIMKVKKRVLAQSAMRSYLCCVDLIDYLEFIKYFELPDTFNSWFRITELHIWLLMVRLASLDREGLFMRNSLTVNFWDDVEKRSKKLGDQAVVKARKEGVALLTQQFYFAIYSYDEGLIGNDKQLASAVWSTFLETNCDNPEKIEKLVEYIRKQVKHLHLQESSVILQYGLVTFLPLHGNVENVERNKMIMNQICQSI